MQRQIPIKLRGEAGREDGYNSHPSCTICGAEYLGDGSCGACLFVASLLADCVLVLNKQYSLRTALHVIANREADSRGDWLAMQEAARAVLNEV